MLFRRVHKSGRSRTLAVAAVVALAATACAGSTEQESDNVAEEHDTASGEEGTGTDDGTSSQEGDESATGNETAVRGVSEDTIRLGAILDLSGPYNAAGVLMRDGISAWVDKVNDEGGIQGRQVEVIYEDNQSDPSATLAAATKLISNDEVFALAGVHGAAAFGAILDLVGEERVPSFSLGLSEEMYNPLREYVFVAAVPYAHQMARNVGFLDEEFGGPKMAVIYQDDEFGESGLTGFDNATEELGMEVVARETFVRGADDLSAQARAVVDAGAEAVACVCIYTQSGLLRRELGRLDAADIPVVAINPSIGAPYFEIAGDSAGNFYAAEYYAHPGDPSYDPANDAVQAAHGRDATTFDLFGLVNAAILLQAMQDADELTPEGVVSALEAMQGVEAPGLLPPVQFGADSRVASFEAAVYEADPTSQSWDRVGDPVLGPGM